MMNMNVVMGIMLGSCVMATSPAWAQVQPSGEQPQGEPSAVDVQRTKIMEQMQDVQERAGQLQDRINTIAREAQEQNPEVQKQYAELMDTYQQKLVEHGYPSESEIQALEKMQQRLTTDAGSMEEAERQQLTQQFNTEVAKLQQSLEKAQSDPDVLAAQKTFEQTRTQAMRDIDPEAAALERELEILQDRLEQLRQQLQQVLQATQQ